MAKDPSGTSLQQHLGSVSEILRTVEQLKAQRSVGVPAHMSQKELTDLTRRLNVMKKIATHNIREAKDETRVDASANGIRSKVTIPHEPNPIQNTLNNVQSRTKAGDLFRLGTFGSGAPETFSQTERDDFLMITQNQRQLRARFSRAIKDHPALRKREGELWTNIAQGRKFLSQKDWQQKPGIDLNPEMKSGLDALQFDAIREAKFAAFARAMEGHREAFHNTDNPRERFSIMTKAEERIAGFSKDLPLSQKAEIRKQGLGFIQSFKAKTADLKKAAALALRPPQASIKISQNRSR